MKPKKQHVNPNWLQLQEKLKSQVPRAPKPSVGSQNEFKRSVLGKRKERYDDDDDDDEEEESDDDSPASILIPTNSNCSLTNEIAMDCEMVGVGSQGNKSALGRVTLVNTRGNVIYDEFVRPVERVVDFRTEVSGIRPRDMRKAKDFQDVQMKVVELINGRVLVGHALHNDLKALLLSHPKKDIRDTSEYQPFLKEGRKRALRVLADEFLGVKIQDGEHCPIEDARAAMLLYQRNKRVWEKSIKDHFKFNVKRKKFNRKRKP